MRWYDDMFNCGKHNMCFNSLVFKIIPFFLLVILSCNKDTDSQNSLSKKKPGHSTKETIASKLNELQPLSAIATNEINFYPDEVFFGDTVYITHFLESKTDLELRWNRRTFADRIRQAERSEITLKYKDLVYNYTQDYYYSNWNGSGSISGQMIDFLLPTHGRLFIGSLTAEIPPLEDLDTPFWIRIRNDLDRDERVNLTIEVKNNTFTSYLPLDRRLVGQELLESSHMITIIKRERDEMESLDRWRQFRTAFPLPGLNWNDLLMLKTRSLKISGMSSPYMEACHSERMEITSTTIMVRTC